jgi:hypothetical protein
MIAHIILNGYVERIKEYGASASPRGMSTLELLDDRIDIPISEVAYRKGGNVAIGFMEGFQLIGGYFDKIQIAMVAGHADLALFTGQSAYGPRVFNQMREVVCRLTDDPASRRALVLVSRHHDTADELPCTTSFQYLVRSGILHTMVSMRSSDAIWGLPYDIIQFSMLSMVVALVLGDLPGTLHIHLGSGHLYSDHPGKTPFEPWGQFYLPKILEGDKPTVDGYAMWAQQSAERFAVEVQKGATSKEALQRCGVRVW